MPSSKLRARRKTARKPPVCIKPKPKPPPPRVSGATAASPTAPLTPTHTLAKTRPHPAPPYPAIFKRNLIYHVYPNLSNPAWAANIAQLRKRWHLFNAHKVIACVTGPGLLEPRAVRQMFPKGIDLRAYPNDPRLRDTATFLDLIKAVKSLDPTEATFYGHTKGASPHHWHSPDLCRAIMYWRNAMYHHLLDEWDRVQQALLTHPCAGCFLLDYSTQGTDAMTSPTGFRYGNWHYAGTFFWYRHDCLYSNPHWPFVGDDPFANEMYLGGLFTPDQAWSANERGPAGDPRLTRLYDPDSYQLRIED